MTRRPTASIFSRRRWIGCCTLTVACCFGAAAQGQARRTGAFKEVQDDPKLPRVLLIGDSISIGYTPAVQQALLGKANVHRAPTNCGPTTRGLEQIDAWLGDGKWDLIHFNWGLHDLKYIDGKHQVPLDQYEKNLQRLTARLAKTGAVLIWCNTTPVPAGCSPPRKNEDVLAFNAAAAKVMKQFDASTNDLYSFAQPQLKQIQRPANVHFTPDGSRVLGKQVAAQIEQRLKQPVAPAAETDPPT